VYDLLELTGLILFWKFTAIDIHNEKGFRRGNFRRGKFRRAK
jgi:hypothetical protein